jgi:hypothetical protein
MYSTVLGVVNVNCSPYPRRESKEEQEYSNDLEVPS